MCFEVSGTILGVFVYTVYYLGLTEVADSCDSGGRKPNQSLRAAYQWHGLTLGVLTVVFVFVTFIGVREQKGLMKEIMNATLYSTTGS